MLNKIKLRRRHPPWLENVNITSDLIYRYQLQAKAVGETLQADLKTLKGVDQVHKKQLLLK